MASYTKNNKGWSVRFRICINGSETHKRISGFKTKKEAELAYLEYISSADRSKQQRSINTFGDVVDEWLLSKQNNIRQSSLYDITNIVNKHFMPTFKNLRIDKITPKQILVWRNGLSDYSFKYQKDLYTTLKQIFNYAEMMHSIPNPCKKIADLRDVNCEKAHKKIEVWTDQDFKIFIEYVCDPIYKALFNFLYYSGCRIGEALALTFTDLDFDNNSVSISKSVARKGSEAWNITSPKNNYSIRIISMPKRIMSELAKIGSELNPEDFVFYGSRPLPKTNIDRVFKKAIKDSSVKKITIHQLRHSHASNLISRMNECGYTILAISKRLGHSTTRITLDTYAHLLQKDRSSLDDAIFDL